MRKKSAHTQLKAIYERQGRIQGGGGTFAPPEFGILCSYFQNSFSVACLRERNPSAKQEK